ncbi:hypothetical protein [Pseudidiomarina halophila]
MKEQKELKEHLRASDDKKLRAEISTVVVAFPELAGDASVRI